MLYRHIESSADHDKLQQDPLQLEEWAAMWQMNFAPSKCYIMSITLKRQPSSFSCSRRCVTLPWGVTFQKYLGVYITNSLNWTKQLWRWKRKRIRSQVYSKNFQRNLTSCGALVKERAYLSLVGPVCEYGPVAWNLRNRTGEERRRQTLCDKRDNNFVWNNFSPNFTLL